jgi:2-C-methyl-D-erythritol 2,4-cyclodiphosphate synthase
VRIGIGYDVHRLVARRDLVLAGVNVAHDKGLMGHSDADVLVHAVCDALLGAAGLGDIGQHFPDKDPALNGISSMILLKQTVQKIRKEGFHVQNIDVTVVAEAPKLTPYRETMVSNMAKTIDVNPAAVNIKFTTHERMGALGREEGISTMCVALLE